ncbi:MAG: hypothetical protein GX163_06760 [Bacteroidetes bacterium]|jgi:hypothetical protein|nr:hypothetical protein [Bacteroidota bacterium]
MSWYTNLLKQDATYWPLTARDAYGNDSYGEPQQIKCRWEDIQELIITADGEEKRSNSYVFVNIDLTNKGYLYLGISEDADPRLIQGPMLIQKFEKIPSIDGKITQRRAWL